jgi:hypothetical protein
MTAKDLLYDFTRALASGLTLLRISIRSILPNLFLINEYESTTKTELVYDGDFPTRKAHAYGEYLDRIGYMFNRERNYQEEDGPYRQRILSALKENSTISGIKNTVSFLLASEGLEADIEIRESHRDFFDATSSTLDAPLRNHRGTLLFGITIYITPKLQVRDSVTYYHQETGAYVTEVYPTGVYWSQRDNIYFKSLLDSFQSSSLRFLLNDITASGIYINRVVVRQAGAGGSKGEVYEYNRRGVDYVGLLS